MSTALAGTLALLAGLASDTIAGSAESAESATRAHGTGPGPSLTIEASASPLLIERGGSGRRQMALPGIEIHATLQVRCSPGSAPASVSLMSADTRVAASGLADGEAQDIALMLAVPAAQFPPVSTKDFCLESEPGSPTLVKPALLSLQGSLRCSVQPDPDTADPAGTPGTDSFAQASTAVDIELRCKPQPDQSESSTAPTRETHRPG